MEFLLEINTEEIPASHIHVALTQIKEKLHHELQSDDIRISKLETYGTCRRLIIVGDFESSQKDKFEQVVGPPKAVAYLPDGNPSPAALGFAKKQGVNVNSLEVLQTERGEYIGINKISKGKNTGDILSEALPRIIMSLSFPKMMRWGSNPMRFSRPIKNVLCLFDQKLLKFSVAGMDSSDSTTGHKIYFPEKIKVNTFSQYKDELKKKKVIIDPLRRKKMILDQAERSLASLDAQLFEDELLMEKLCYDVEHPYVFVGEFPQEYLNLPIEVLSTAMKVGQNLFSVVKGRKQQPYFLGVADASKDTKSLIKNGNARVLKARLEDAKYFWEKDVKTQLKKKSCGLEQIIFQEKLGSYQDKVDRLKKIAAYIAAKLDRGNEKKTIIETAELCKIDLLTEMVREFPSLQGRIGGLYAKHEGYPQNVWKGIYEHYLPQSLEEASPSSFSGSILSIADKMDSVVGVFGIGKEVSGSKDPFGLRRNAQGICKIILDKKLNFSFFRLCDKVIAVYGENLVIGKEDLKAQCVEFFKNRLQYILEKRGYRYDLINAALASGIDNLYFTFLKVKALDSLKESPQFEPLIHIAKRVNNILRDQPKYKVNSEILFEKEERELYTTFTIIRDNVSPLLCVGDYSQAQKMIFRLRSSINTFFDKVMVITDDQSAKRNRLALLQEISKFLFLIADYSQIVIEG
ncbi:MAG: glycine--tRNA ligase subunit beta [Candidatus Aminicenantes bacterium]|nr:glycine--tRNA ligase subunit beta [Candidatus Aminicenantes bacterium]